MEKKHRNKVDKDKFVKQLLESMKEGEKKNPNSNTINKTSEEITNVKRAELIPSNTQTGLDATKARLLIEAKQENEKLHQLEANISRAIALSTTVEIYISS